MAPRWRIEMLGGLRAEASLEGTPRVVTHFETRKTAALLSYLAYFPGRPHSRELLAELLWPEEDPEATRVRLRAAFAALRRILEPPGFPPGSILITDRLTAQLDREAVVTDVSEFEAALQHAARTPSPTDRIAILTPATGLYGGELLPGYYEEWILPERARLASAHLGALARLADDLAAVGDVAGAIDHARQAVANDPLQESAHCQLMRFYALTGRRVDALRQFRDLERLLADELRATPSAETQALAREIERGSVPEQASEFQQGGGRVEEQGRVGPPAQRPEPETSQLSCTPLHPGSPARVPLTGQPVLEPPGGAVPLASPFYIERPADEEFRAALARQDSIVLVKGPRQVGKTSLLARGLHQARQAGARVVLTDFQKLTSEQLASTEALIFTIAELMAEELGLEQPLEEVWNPRRGWNVNLERFLRRQVLGERETPLVWGLDEVDRLFPCPFASEVFGLFRSWHNERSLRPDAGWQQLTLAIAYATEAHLFITDLNQSPFNIGTRLELEDFTPEQLAELNRRCGSPLRGEVELGRCFQLVGGHPYLARRALHAMVTRGLDLDALEAQAARDTGPFGDHLRRLWHSLSQDPDLCAALGEALRRGACPTVESFYRLRSAGVLLGDSAGQVRPRCHLYRLYLESQLA